jgi:hypothetical protein
LGFCIACQLRRQNNLLPCNFKLGLGDRQCPFSSSGINDRLSFLNLLHFHPTLAVKLLGQQHDRLREQRANGTLCY